MNERAAFESAIDSHPEDATNHLVYADWLDEHGEPDEAAFRRSMGNWVSRRPRIRRTGRSGFSLSRTHPWWTWVGNYPEGVGDIPQHHVFSGYGSYTTEHDPAMGVFYGRGVNWMTYRGMENAFRDAFMANRRRSNQPEQLSRLARHAGALKLRRR